MIRCFTGLVMVVVLTTMAARAQAEGARSLQDLVDERASSGERELESRGYEYRKTIKVKESSIDYWWKRRGEHCIAVTTRDGRYALIMDQPESMCEGARASSGGSHGGIDDLEGMRASSGERELESQGYEYRRSIKTRGGSISYWWKQRAKRCIAVTTKDGRYSAVMEQPRSVCDDDEASGSGHHGSRHYEGSGSEAPPGGFHAPGNGDGSPPEIIMGSNGEGEVTFGDSRCVVYYDSKGRRTKSLPACDKGQIQHADRAMAAHRREQGM